MEVSSDPKAFVATQVNKAESPLSVLLMLMVDNTPSAWISSRIVYLQLSGSICAIHVMESLEENKWKVDLMELYSWVGPVRA